MVVKEPLTGSFWGFVLFFEWVFKRTNIDCNPSSPSRHHFILELSTFCNIFTSIQPGFNPIMVGRFGSIFLFFLLMAECKDCVLVVLLSYSETRCMLGFLLPFSTTEHLNCTEKVELM